MQGSSSRLQAASGAEMQEAEPSLGWGWVLVASWPRCIPTAGAAVLGGRKCFVYSRETKVGTKTRLVESEWASACLIRWRWGWGLLGGRPSDWGSLGVKEGRQGEGGESGSPAAKREEGVVVVTWGEGGQEAAGKDPPPKE